MASIAEIDGLTIPSAAAFLLDTYTGAAAAYSVRRLATATTVLLRVRRDTGGGTGDDDEADVTYDLNNELSLDSAISNASTGVTATTLGQFINVGTVGGTTYTNPDSLTVTASCYVDTWYDQAASNDAIQNTHESQPEIHDGTVNTDLVQENGQPALSFDGANDKLSVATNFTTGTTNRSSFTVAHCLATTPNSQDMVYGMHNTATSGTLYFFTAESAIRVSGSAVFSSSVQDSQSLCSLIFDGTTTDDITLHLNGAAKAQSSSSGTTINTGSNGFDIGSVPYGSALGAFEGPIQELVFYNNAKNTTDRSGIESDINTYFSIY
ncbi:hypothetical protein [Limnobacter sp.]|uniref:hypothetical protein n=1 Tax=Limnobacter sp. TaxID=2003368 RepID=UPI0025BB0848|nr:hypothetical protein [Limnobacter sp.]